MVLLTLLALTTTSVASTRMEYLLEEAPASEVMNFLRCIYPNAEFIPHPTMNGFYMNGTREDMLSVKRGLAHLDTLSPLPEPPETTTIAPKKLNPSELALMIRRRVPSSECEPAGGSLIFRGPATVRGRAIAALRELDYPLERIRVSRRQLAEAPAGACAYPNHSTAWGCPEGDCGGFLHLTGLRVGDEVMVHVEREDPRAPFWIVYRGGLRMNIFVEFE